MSQFEYIESKMPNNVGLISKLATTDKICQPQLRRLYGNWERGFCPTLSKINCSKKYFLLVVNLANVP